MFNHHLPAAAGGNRRIQDRRPHEAFVRVDGSARVGIYEAYDPSEVWIAFYWIDVDNNQLCEDDGADIIRQHALPLVPAALP